VDGVDFRIAEPSPFSRDWFSHKFRAAALRYEIVLSVGEPVEICSAHGPFKPGKFTDLDIARDKLALMLDETGEQSYADRGYVEPQGYFVTPRDVDSNPDERRFLKLVRARHETVNKRVKQFQCLSMPFRHDRTLHADCFHAVLNLTQLSLEDAPLFRIYD